MNATKEWPKILGLSDGSTITEDIVHQQYRRQAKKFHPDSGGSVDAMQQLNAAKELALNWIARERQRQEELKRAKVIAKQHFAAANQAMNQAYQHMASQQMQYANDLVSMLGSMGQAAKTGSQIADNLSAKEWSMPSKLTFPQRIRNFISSFLS